MLSHPCLSSLCPTWAQPLWRQGPSKLASPVSLPPYSVAQGSSGGRAYCAEAALQGPWCGSRDPSAWRGGSKHSRPACDSPSRPVPSLDHTPHLPQVSKAVAQPASIPRNRLAGQAGPRPPVEVFWWHFRVGLDGAPAPPPAAGRWGGTWQSSPTAPHRPQGVPASKHKRFIHSCCQENKIRTRKAPSRPPHGSQRPHQRGCPGKAAVHSCLRSRTRHSWHTALSPECCCSCGEGAGSWCQRRLVCPWATCRGTDPGPHLLGPQGGWTRDLREGAESPGRGRSSASMESGANQPRPRPRLWA